jgi:hypothetical protein
MARSMIRGGVFVALLVLATACGGYWRARPGVIYVGIAPPTPYGEVAGAPPGRGYAWMPGRWEWRDNSYIWVAGGYVASPAGYSEWVPGQWSHDYHGWFYIGGRWR